ncbi:MAG: exodeoxyribonuclease V subunit beta [Methylococcales bacterium]|nr:exodeoxyribonuclease V subunit beta [Methylococcales bacterium]
MAVNPFDAAASQLRTDVNLIEAAAGTGKTYAIAMLVLRFVVEQGLAIQNILVVTFTRAATEELKDRIRKRLLEARQALKADNAVKADDGLQRWMDSLTLDVAQVRQRLDQALLNIDQAAIFTIHGFCQRALAEHALESGQMFDCELSGDIAVIRRQCADDFWRRQLYLRPAWQAGLLTAVFRTPDELLSSVGRVNLQHSVYPDAADPGETLESMESLIARASEVLPGMIETLAAAFKDGLFNDSFVGGIHEKSTALLQWLHEPDTEMADFFWLTSPGLQAGLNGRKFLASKKQPLPTDQQKRQYLAEIGIDCSLFDQLAEAMQELQVRFRRALLEDLRNELDKTLQQHNVLSFDDLISRLYQALSADIGPMLISGLQQRFAAALIDEFQDTDKLQWRIFAQIFATPQHFLYLIGDPKQAIYKFRGADIYSYFAAQRLARHRYTLLRNWRSHPGLVAGVNQLFQRNAPFLLPELPFHPVEAARSAENGSIGSIPPLSIWQLDRNRGKLEHWTAGKAAIAVRDAVVEEILRLLADEGVMESGLNRKLQPRDMAVLVRSNTQAVEYREALNAAGIPAVLNSRQSVFATRQAQALYTVLQAVAQPGHILSLKQALTVDWFNLDGRQLYSLFNDEIGLDQWLSRFQQYNQLWRREGFLVMMQALLQQEQIELQLAGQPQAERLLTDLHQIIECLQQAGSEEHLTINKTLDWLLHAMQNAELDSQEDRMLRLESDEDTVKIVTLHSAKGLEYPLVFCPNLWQRSDRLKTEKNLVQCHENGEMITDLGSERFAQRRSQALYEELAEDLRLFYVAVTRAKYRCYIAWADVRSKDNANDSAMAYLLELGDADFAAQQQKFMALVHARPEAFQYRVLPAETGVSGYYRPEACRQTLACRRRRRALSSHWQMSSYTALSAFSLTDAPELPEDKAAEPEDARQSLTDADEGLTERAAIFAAELPKGPQTGNVLHSLLETCSFHVLATGEDISRFRDQAIRRYGLKIDTPAVLDRLLQTVVSASLETGGDFCLKNLVDSRCLKEMPFYLSMQAMDTALINRVLAESPTFQPLSAKQMSGYLTGFIDLICEYQGKYYVMDYKTNSLPDYQPETLLQAMREHNYGLQYWLYSLVLDRLLLQRLPGYEHARHFGGVKYLFLRGMRADAPGSGVFADLPSEKALRCLGQVFFG